VCDTAPSNFWGATMTDTVAVAGDSGFSIGRVASRTFAVLGRNLVTFLGLSILVVIPQLLFSTFMVRSFPANGVLNPAMFMSGAYWLEFSATTLLWLVLSFVLQAALTYGTVMDLNGKRVSAGDALLTGIRLFLPLFGIAIIFGLGTAFGFLFLIVPGFMLLMAWFVVVPVRVTEGTGISESFSRSAQLTKGNRWSIFGLLIIYLVALILFQLITRPLFGVAMIAPQPGSLNIAYLIFESVIRGITTVISATGVACVYYELRTSKEGLGPEQLASVFE
jgi:hypothetical protein